jgi:hypothetical protein
LQRDLEGAWSAADARLADLEAARARLEALEAQKTDIENARTEVERACHEANTRADAANTRADAANTRADAAVRERDGLIQERDGLSQAVDTARGEAHAQAQAQAEAQAQAQSAWRDTELANTERAWKEAEARAEAATRDRDALNAELQAERQATTAAQAEAQARLEQVLETADRRIRDLEQQLTDRVVAPATEPEAPLAEGLLDADLIAEAPLPDQPARTASRHAFTDEVQILIDNGSAVLVDLSTSGAQVVSPTSLKPNRVVTLQLPSDAGQIECRGKIVWARLDPSFAAGSLWYRAGVCFTGVDVPALEAFLAGQTESRQGKVSRYNVLT